MPNILSKKGFIKNTLFYVLHAHRIQIKSHIVHHTIYKFGEKEDRYMKLKYSRTYQPHAKLSDLASMLPRVTCVDVTTMQCAYWCLRTSTAEFRWRGTAFLKGTCMPITRSYVKEGTYRRKVFQALSTNNPCRSQYDIKQESLQVKWCFCSTVSL